uniref:Uncharacterized protein n=1 Tax=Arundo donax TaxID=35708 RepID=A0A0A9FCE0_ARUDO
MHVYADADIRPENMRGRTSC